jgi:hypothetical protein
MTVAWVAVGISVATSVFWIGYYFGSLRGQVQRMRVRIRDLERAYEKVAHREYRTRYPEDDDRERARARSGTPT